MGEGEGTIALKPQLRMRAHPDQLKRFSIGLAINENEVRPEMAITMIFPFTGQRVIPRRALDLGYIFRYPEIDQAFRGLFGE